MSLTSTDDILSRATGNVEPDNFILSLKKKAAQSNKDAVPPLVSKDAKTKWTFLRKNTDVLTRKSILSKISEQRYKHYSQVPSPEEFFNTLMIEKNMHQKIIQQRRQTFQDKQTKERTNIVSLVFNEKLAKIAEQKRNEKNQKELSKFIRLLRTNPDERNIDDLNIILDWMMKHTPHESIVYQFLLRCSKKEVLQFCAGLNYGVYGTKEAIIRQHERGTIYYILISGKSSVYINKHLPKHCIADESDPHGIGEKIDVILPGGDFGEYALLQKVKRTATVLSEMVSECIQITEQHFQESIARYVNRYTVMVNKYLRGFYELQDATDRNLNSMFKKFKKLTIYPGKVLQTQNQSIKNIYFIKNATISEWYNLNSKSKSTKHSIRQPFRKMRLSTIQCNNGVVIGGFYAIKNMVAPSTIICDSECSALAISADQWIREVSTNVIEKMTELGTIKNENTLKRIDQIKQTSSLISDTLKIERSSNDKLPLMPIITSPIMKKKKDTIVEHFGKISTQKAKKKKKKRSQSFVRNVSYTANKQRLRSASVLNLHHLAIQIHPTSKQKTIQPKNNNNRSKSMIQSIGKKNNREFRNIKKELSRLSCKYERRQTCYFK